MSFGMFINSTLLFCLAREAYRRTEVAAADRYRDPTGDYFLSECCPTPDRCYRTRRRATHPMVLLSMHACPYTHATWKDSVILQISAEADSGRKALCDAAVTYRRAFREEVERAGGD